MPSPPSTVFLGTLVHTPQLGCLEILHRHALTIDSSGCIMNIQPADKATLPSDALIVQIPRGSFLLPSFHDLHLHAPQFLYLGTGLHLPLMEWLQEYAFKAEERIDNDPVLARRVYAKLAERLIQAGTSAALLFGTIKEDTNIILAEVFQQAGLRGFVGKLSMDQNSRPSYIETSAQDALTSAAAFIERCRNLVMDLPSEQQLVEPVITPRFVPTCSDELLEGLSHLARTKGVKVQSHMAEARDQIDWVKSERGIEDIQVFEQRKLLGSQTIQAHCTYVTPSDLSHLHATGTSVAHCALSNVYFSHKPFPLREALDAGVKVGLGSDVAGGYAIDLMTGMRQTVATSRMREGERKERKLDTRGEDKELEKDVSLAVDWTEAFYLATKGGAQALGLRSGEFVVGAPFDAQMIALVDPSTSQGVGNLDFFDPLPDQLTAPIIEKWWCLGNAQNRTGMWVQGKRLL